MNPNGVLRMRVALLFALLLLLSGCATTQKLNDGDRNKIGIVRINSSVQKAPDMYYLGPGTSVFFAFGALGGAAIAAASAEPAKALQRFAESNGIFVEKIAFEEIGAAFRQSGRLKVSNSGEPTDAVINVIVYHYGFSVPHGFSSRLGPVLGISCDITDAAGKILGSARDYVIKSPVETMTLEEMRADPKLIENAWRISAKRIAANIRRDLGYDGGVNSQAGAANAQPQPVAGAATPVGWTESKPRLEDLEGLLEKKSK